MDQILDQAKYALEVAWYKVTQEANSRVVLLVAAVAVILLLWLFLSPEVKRKG